MNYRLIDLNFFRLFPAPISFLAQQLYRRRRAQSQWAILASGSCSISSSMGWVGGELRVLCARRLASILEYGELGLRSVLVLRNWSPQYPKRWKPRSIDVPQRLGRLPVFFAWILAFFGFLWWGLHFVADITYGLRSNHFSNAIPVL